MKIHPVTIQETAPDDTRYINREEDLQMISSEQYRLWLDELEDTKNIHQVVNHLYQKFSADDGSVVVSMNEVMNAIWRYRTDKELEQKTNQITRLYLYTSHALNVYEIHDGWEYTYAWELANILHDFMTATGEAPKLLWELNTANDRITITVYISSFYMAKSIAINFYSFHEAIQSPVYTKLCSISLPWWAAIPDITE
jgi:hypothetical protein